MVAWNLSCTLYLYIYAILIIYYTIWPFDQKPILLKKTQQQTDQPTTFFTTLHRYPQKSHQPTITTSDRNPSAPSPLLFFLGEIQLPCSDPTFSWISDRLGAVDVVRGNFFFPRSFFHSECTPLKAMDGWGFSRRLTVCLFGVFSGHFQGRTLENFQGVVVTSPHS